MAANISSSVIPYRSDSLVSSSSSSSGSTSHRYTPYVGRYQSFHEIYAHILTFLSQVDVKSADDSLGDTLPLFKKRFYSWLVKPIAYENPIWHQAWVFKIFRFLTPEERWESEAVCSQWNQILQEPHCWGRKKSKVSSQLINLGYSFKKAMIRRAFLKMEKKSLEDFKKRRNQHLDLYRFHLSSVCHSEETMQKNLENLQGTRQRLDQLKCLESVNARNVRLKIANICLLIISCLTLYAVTGVTIFDHTFSNSRIESSLPIIIMLPLMFKFFLNYQKFGSEINRYKMELDSITSQLSKIASDYEFWRGEVKFHQASVVRYRSWVLDYHSIYVRKPPFLRPLSIDQHNLLEQSTNNNTILER